LEDRGLKGQSKFQIAEAEAEMIKCFERASDLGLLCLQGQDSTTSMNTLNGGVHETRRMGAVLETTLQRAPIVLIKTGKLQTAIERYRMMLNAVETRNTQMLRLTLARQLAEVLLRGVSGTIYSPPGVLSPARKGLWQPKKYSGRNQFIPRNQHEETILLLLISEALAVRDAVLSQSPEFREARVHALGNATAVYDLMTLATVRWGQIGLLHESFEKALKFAFHEQHVWRQYALCLVSLGRHGHALSALLESAKLTTHDNLAYLMAARLCYESLGQVKQGLGYAYEALKRETKGNSSRGGPVTRAQLYVGIGLQQIAIVSNLKSEKEKYGKLAMEALEKAVQQDPNDHLSEYYLACQYAMSYNILEALHHIRNALAMRAEHAPSLHLFALLLTANRKPRDALYVLEDAIGEFPDNLNLLHVKAHLELYLQNAETALHTVERMLQIWRELYEAQTSGMDSDAMEKQSDTRSVMIAPSQISDKDSSELNIF
jgi:tetratricopeptide repeat protein 7